MEAVKRADIVLVALPGDYGKPRPAVIVQSDLFNDTHPSITLAPITSELRDAPLFRITLEPSSGNGLRRLSQIMVDKMHTVARERIGPVIGRLDEPGRARLDRSLMLWIGIP